MTHPIANVATEAANPPGTNSSTHETPVANQAGRALHTEHGAGETAGVGGADAQGATPESNKQSGDHPQPSAALSSAPATGAEEVAPESRRIIKRYSNRKLYDTRQSRYVTLLQIAEMVRAGEDVQIIDNASKEDKTDITLALIISEELKLRPRAIPIASLKALIRHRGERLLTQLRDSPIGRLIPGEEDGLPIGTDAAMEDTDVNKENPGAFRRALEQWQHSVDERIRAVVPQFATIQELQGQVQRLSQRLADLERRLDSPRE